MTGFNILVDGILLSSSVVACFYCILLSRRVRQLASADQGVGKGIADMTHAVERLNTSLEQTRMATRSESETLERRLGEARSLSERMAEQSDDSEALLEELATGLSDARLLVKSLEGLVETADKRRQRARRVEDKNDWRPDLSDGLPAGAPRAGASPPPPELFSPSRGPARPAVEDDDVLLLDAMALDQSEGESDPLPDVIPITRRRATRHGQPVRRGA